MDYKATLDFAKEMDQQDALRGYRNQFFIPKMNGTEVIYFTGNSLGLQPKSVKDYLQTELDDWANHGVEGHFHAKNPWYFYHHTTSKALAKIVGANESEVCAMNTLSVNLNILMVSFYRPMGAKRKILIEQNAFPSDIYAVEQQIKFHGGDPKTDMIIMPVTDINERIDNDALIAKIEANRDELALVMIGGVNYYTGQVFDMKRIAEACHKNNVVIGYDLAHAVGNIELQLHDWGVDFATWCSYKYLNSGPGGVSAIFVHEKHGENPNLPRFAGWWGNDENTRFTIPKNFIPQKGAAGWQMSNAQILPLAAHRASLEIFEQAGMKALRAKSLQLTGYLEFLVNQLNQLTILTPTNPDERGCQLSLVANSAYGKELHNYLTEKGVIADWREPNVIRVAPAPLYNSFEDVFRFYEILCAFPKF